MSRRLTSSLALLIPLSSALVGAQVRTIDQGSFTITMNNQRIGREDFSIVEDASTQNLRIMAKATVEYRERGLKLQPLLTANATGASTEYDITVRGGALQRWTGTIDRNRVRSMIFSERGQAAKEFVVAVGAMVLDDDVFHQYYFVAKRAGEGSIPVIIPQRSAQSAVTVARLGAERIDIGNAQVEAQKLSVTEGSGPTREVWVDSQGRVLRVAIPSRAIVAARDELPANR
jgi:hypothetical protein